VSCVVLFFPQSTLQRPNDHGVYPLPASSSNSYPIDMIQPSRSIPAALRPPPNTPLTPTFPTSLAPFTSSLSTSYEDPSVDSDADDDEPDPYTISSYGLVTPSESYIPPSPPSTPPSPLSSSPKRYPHGCLRLRPPIRRPPLPNRTSGGTFSGYGYGGYGGWSCPKIVIGGNNSVPSSPITAVSTSTTKVAYPGYLRSPPSPTSPSHSPTSCRPSPSPNSPVPLPIRLRPLPPPCSKNLPHPNALPAHLRSNAIDLTSDSETDVEPELEDEGDASASDTCASDSDSEDISGTVKVRVATLTSKPKSRKHKSTMRLPIPNWDSSVEDEEVGEGVVKC
jgi:hypothetical protein